MARIAINGFGRIGRNILRAAIKRGERFDVVHINDIDKPKTLAHLFKYDSVHGIFDGTVESTEDAIVVNGKKIAVTAKRDPSELPHKQHGCEMVLECSGRFTDRASAEKHIAAGAKKVIISAPAKVLMDSFGIERGFMTTVHSYTNDQRILDLPHEDLRRARAAALSMIPASTGAAKAIGLVLPELAGKLDGMAVRVPTPNVSLVDLTAELEKPATEADVNAAMKKAADGPLKGILHYCDEPLVSG